MDTLTIVEDYLSKNEEKELLEYIYSQPWSKVLSRRVQHYGYEYSYFPPYGVKKTKEIPKLFLNYINKINPKFNQVIVNEYLPGQGIGKHTDHKLFFNDMICSLSLGSPTIIFRKGENREEIFLKNKSLLIMSGESRWKWTHEIPQRKGDAINGNYIERQTRISLTFREVVNEYV